MEIARTDMAKTTVEEFVTERAGAELGLVFAAVARACQGIERKIRFAGLGDVYGAFGAVNVQGEQQQKLDVYANDELTEQLGEVHCVAAIVSEEDDGAVTFEVVAAEEGGKEYAVVFDPLDGSSNIDVNVNVGTIFSVVRVDGDVVDSVLKPGLEQVAAGYVVYGPSTVMVVAFGALEGVAGFTLDEEGAFVLTSESMMIPAQGPYYSANEANVASWPVAYREYVAMLVEKGLHGKAYSARYIGSLVADFHRTLLKGGVFLYPPTEKAPKGKLRLLYEARPLALIAEKAGGAAVNGAVSANGGRILDLAAKGIHERTPLIVGSKAEVEALHRMVMGVAE